MKYQLQYIYVDYQSSNIFQVSIDGVGKVMHQTGITGGTLIGDDQCKVLNY